MPRAFTHCSAVTDNEWDATLCAAPKFEARCLVQLLGKNGLTIDKLREVIRVTPEEIAILRASALHSRILAEQIERVLRYRVLVAQEFDHLVRALPKNPPKMEARELSILRVRSSRAGPAQKEMFLGFRAAGSVRPVQRFWLRCFPGEIERADVESSRRR